MKWGYRKKNILSKKTPSPIRLRVVIRFFGESIDRMKFDEAEELMLQWISLFDELEIRPRYAVDLMNLGELYGNEGRTEKTLENPKKAKEILQEMG